MSTSSIQLSWTMKSLPSHQLSTRKSQIEKPSPGHPQDFLSKTILVPSRCMQMLSALHIHIGKEILYSSVVLNLALQFWDMDTTFGNCCHTVEPHDPRIKAFMPSCVPFRGEGFDQRDLKLLWLPLHTPKKEKVDWNPGNRLSRDSDLFPSKSWILYNFWKKKHASCTS